MGDTSLVFNLVAKDQTTGELSEMGQKWATAGAAIGAGLAAALGVGVAQAMDMSAANAKMAAQLDLTGPEAARAGDIAGAVFSDGFGQSIGEVNDALSSVASSMGDLSDFTDAELKELTKGAMVMADVLEFDVGESAMAAGALLNTGLAKTGKEAFDLLTAGAKALPKSMRADLPSIIGEYSTQFRRLGLDGQTAMALLAQGVAHGARDVDQVSDAIGQFGELALAGGTAVEDAFKSIGLDADTMAAKVGKGGKTAAGALQETLDALRGTKDEQTKLNAATALFGDPGTVMGKALFALDPAGAAAETGLDKANGAAGRLVDGVADSPAHALQSLKNTVMTQLGEIAGVFLTFGTEHTGLMKGLAVTLGVVAGVVMAVAVAQKVHATYTAIATAAENLHNSTLYKVVAGYVRLMAVGLAAMARMAAASVASAATTAAAWMGSALASIGTWIAAVVRAAVTSAAQFVMMAARAVAWAATMAAQWLIAMGPIGWVIAAVVALVVLIIANWDRIKAATAAVWGWIWGKIKAIATNIKNAAILAAVAIYNGWVRANNAIRGAVSAAWSWILGKIRGVMTGAKNAVIGGIARIGNAFLSIHTKAASALSGAGRWLYNAGRSIIQGLVNGIRNMAGAVGGAVKGVLSKARNLLPFSPAKEGPFSGKGWTLYSGESMMSGLAEGIDRRRTLVTTAVQDMAERARSAMPGGAGGGPLRAAAPIAAGSASGGIVRVQIDLTGDDEHLKQRIRRIAKVTSGGNVQLTFGRG